jgi:hypothetical protein
MLNPAAATKRIIYDLNLYVKYVFGKVKHYRTGEQKTKLKILEDLIRWQYREREFNKMFYAMGLNLKMSDIDDYIGTREFRSIKTKVENKIRKDNGVADLNYQAVTKDKFVAESFLKGNHLPCVESLALIKDSSFIPLGCEATGLEALIDSNDALVFKLIDKEASEGFILLERQGKDEFLINKNPANLIDLYNRLSAGIWLVQPQIRSHPEIVRVSSKALCTARIMTVLDDPNPSFLAGFHAFTTSDVQSDAWANGSIFVGIDQESLTLQQDGFYSLSQKNHAITQDHPQSGVAFKGMELPWIQEAVKLCLDAHKLLYSNFILGWDIAITERGPLIVEINENPGIKAIQCTNAGLRKRIMQAADKFLDNHITT